LALCLQEKHRHTEVSPVKGHKGHIRRCWEHWDCFSLEKRRLRGVLPERTNTWLGEK